MKRLRTLPSDASGATLVEFALLAPVLLLTLLGLFELGYNYYMQTQLQGAIQKAARDSTIEGATGREAQIDANVAAAVRTIVPNAQITFARKSYAQFSDVRQPEDFTDIDESGDCNDGEPFEDANGNGIWDEDRGAEGFGGARDAVLYVVGVSYPRAFGVAGIAGLSPTFSTEASTVLRNQPFGEQNRSVTVENCV